MGAKNNDESIKYEIKCSINVDGVVSESDIVGALFGQTEGLLDQDMDLKQLQKSGRIGRINLNLYVKSGKTQGKVRLPSSLNKIETAVIAATLESVDRVGPCVCLITVEEISDVRLAKRERIANRASEIMKKWELDTRRDQEDITAFVEKDTKKGKIQTFGPDRLPAGPEIYDAQEVILVEGRADVLNLMKMDINNTIGIKGTKVPASIKSLSKSREITALLDGDRGGDMILKELALHGRIEYVARAPYKKEVEDLSYDAVMEALDAKVPLLDARFISEKSDVAEFLGKENRGREKSKEKYSKSKKGNGKGIVKPTLVQPRSSSKPSSRRNRQRSPRSDRMETSAQRDDHERSDRHRSGRDDRQRSADTRDTRRRSSDDRRRPPRDDRRRDDRSFRKPRIEVSQAIASLIQSVKSTFKAILVGKSNEPILTVETKEVYQSLQDTDGVESVIIDGVITQRLLDVAQAKQVKLVAGAVIGEITNRPNEVSFTTFNRI